ncbi:MAG: type II toxin-antitoxin system VapC family toxin [Chloroflexota bacterium]|nr:type II toxin-antitoxin system VapC family toxin [Chloroflexota bacterium]
MIVLDTNVISELMLELPVAPVASWWSTQPVADLYITTVVEGELRYGAARLPVGRRRGLLFQSIDLVLTNFLPDRILPFDRAAASEYATIMAHRRSIGRPMEGHELDCMIAAIARSNGAAVATRNVRDFTDCGVEIINPWEAAATQ